MAVYYITISILFVLLVVAQNYINGGHSRNKYFVKNHSYSAKLFFVLASLLMIFVAGFRYGVGADYFAYVSNYQEYASEMLSSIKSFDEPGFKILCWIIVKLGGNGNWLIFVSSLITIGLYFFTIFRETDQLLSAGMLFVFLGCWHSSFNAIRQCIAAAIIFYGIKFIQNRKFIKYVIVVIVAASFHISAIIMIFAYFILNNKVCLKNMLIMIVGTIIVLSSFEKILSIAGVILDTTYSSSDTYIYSGVSLLRTLVAISPAIYFLIMCQHKNGKQQLYLNCLILNAIFMLATSNSTYIARMGIYTAPFVAIAIPELLRRFSSNNRKVSVFLIYPLYAYFWWYEIVHSSALCFFRFIWQK